MSDIYVGIREGTEDEIPESDLRQHVCPRCGNVDILIGDEELDKDVKPILAGDKLDECCSYYRCAGGLGEFRYRYLPHKCTACGARFTAVKKEKAKINKEAVGWLMAFAFVVAAHIALSMLLIAHDGPAFVAPFAILAPVFMVYVSILIKIDENTYDKDPGPDYICEYGPSDAAFRRLEIEYDERLKDLKAKEAFSDEELEKLVAAEDLVDACGAPKKSVQDIYGALTPEQKMEMEMELLKQRLQAQQHYILQGADPSNIVTLYADGRPVIQVPQPTIRPWDIRPW